MIVRPRARLLRVVLAGGVVLAALAVAQPLGARTGGSSPAIEGAAAAAKLLRGIPQRGIVLGSPRAPVTLVEYADLQCPYCGAWARDTFPTLVREYVRTGKVKMVFRGLAFVGPESMSALRAVLAAGGQNRLWHVVELLYANQGEENSGWVTDGFLRALGRSVKGLDVKRMMRERSSEAVLTAMEDAKRRADFAGINGTPSFEVGRSSGPLMVLPIRSLDAGAFRPALHALLAG